MKLFTLYVGFFVLSVALYEIGSGTSNRMIYQAGMVATFASIVVATRIAIALIREVRNYTFK
ncbi:hypothetical protein M2401_006806 [Pseudomonas sp. JUb42]|uniref:hypothetical protein n=1 Tax=Pseudomonas sp. JUb42 TaxID=2940611 RepID=UPI00216A14CD|nr:hypothetical protein [Pseudomonas sp. JUb42]MCS3473038.1 hypothetical protein [Pseudomonas sp. JUb42]